MAVSDQRVEKSSIFCIGDISDLIGVSFAIRGVGSFILVNLTEKIESFAIDPMD